jgi:hypothetical protein
MNGGKIDFQDNLASVDYLEATQNDWGNNSTNPKKW